MCSGAFEAAVSYSIQAVEKLWEVLFFSEKLTCHPRPFDRLPPQQFRLSKVQARVHSRKIGEQ
jgi:hypothetical protein